MDQLLLQITSTGQSLLGGAWPVVAFVLSVLFLGETLTVRKGLGIFLVVLGAAFLR